jgi:hypothetical protein
MTVEPALLDGDGNLKPLRNSIADGSIEGEDYVVTQDLSSGAILVEFDENTVVYNLPDLVKDAYAFVHEDDEEENVGE